MRILGIDPATRLLGYALLDGTHPLRPRVINSGTKEVKGERAMDRMEAIHNWAFAIMKYYRPDALAIESGVLYKRARRGEARAITNVETALLQAEARGIVMATAYARGGIRVAKVTPTEVKKASTGNGSAKKATVQATIAAKFGLTHVEPDEADAIAVALAFLYRADAQQVLHRVSTAPGGRP